jgi:hypothetical protein
MSGTPAWLARFPVSRGGSWAAHRARGSLGGVDWAAPAGTRIKSPSAGVVSYRVMRDGSSVAKVKRDDGTATEFLHGRPLGGPRRVELDEDIAISDGRPGTPGAGPSTGAHIHAHDLTAAGVRVPPFSTIREIPRRKARAVTLYYMKTTTGTLFALAGDSPGTPANWLETRDQAFANALAAQHGNAAQLSAASFAAWKSLYLAPLAIAGGAGSSPSPSAAEIAEAVGDDLAARLQD